MKYQNFKELVKRAMVVAFQSGYYYGFNAGFKDEYNTHKAFDDWAYMGDLDALAGEIADEIQEGTS